MYVLDLPKSAKILSVAKQDNEPVLYALVDDTEQEQDAHVFKIVGTGHPFEDENLFDYLGSISTHNDTYTWHIFIRKS